MSFDICSLSEPAESLQFAVNKKTVKDVLRIVLAIYLIRNEKRQIANFLVAAFICVFGECFSSHRSIIIVGSTQCTDWRSLWIICPVIIYQMYLEVSIGDMYLHL